MTTLTTLPELEQSQLDYFDAIHHQVDDDAGDGDPLTSIAFDVHKHQRSIQTLETANRAYSEEILTLKARVRQLTATIEDLVTHRVFHCDDEIPF